MTNADSGTAVSQKQAPLSATIDADRLMEFLEVIETFREESVIKATEDGLTSLLVDPAHVGLSKVELSADAFEIYETDGVEIGINHAQFRNVLELAPEGDVHLEFWPDEKRLHMDAGAFHYMHDTIDPGNLHDPPDAPSLDLTATVMLEVSQYVEAVKTIDEFAKHLVIGNDDVPEEFYFEAASDLHDAEYRYSHAEIPKVVESGKARSLFSLDFCKDVAESMPENRLVEINVGEDYPAILKYGIVPDGDPLEGEFHGSAEMYVAPRLKE